VADAQLARGKPAEYGSTHGDFVLKVHFLTGHDAGSHEALGQDGVGADVFQMRLLAAAKRGKFAHGFLRTVLIIGGAYGSCKAEMTWA
jgi:hypothetical protein